MNRWKVFDLAVVGMLIGNTILVIATFTQALLHNYQVTIFVNSVGEAWIEYPVLIVLLLASVLVWVRMVRKCRMN